MNSVYDVVVIGGGASGMMAACVAASNRKKVLLLEKNVHLGRKLGITGGGRCNITNAETDIRVFLENYGSARDFLFSSFSKFSSEDTFDFFDLLGLQLTVQARGRVFPESQKATDVVGILKKTLEKNNVAVRTGVVVKRINSNLNKIISVDTSDGVFEGKSFILATGGVSHPETGSTGDGFMWLRSLGHKVIDPTPTIVPLAVSDDWIKVLAGVSLSFMKVTFYLDSKKQFSKLGKVLFTHFGLSGPLILNSAASVGELLLNGEVTAKIDTFPDTDLGALNNKIVNIFNANKNKNLRTVFKEIVPRGTAKGINLLLPQINFDTPVHSITKEERKIIVDLLKSLPVSITGLMGNDRAVSADGGVVLKEIDMRSMRSKLYENLYVTGDLLHINRPSGGYSLQLCWTTGFIAGNSI